MSLVSTYVRADDGEMYRNPVLEGEGWFICFDDDDPVEVVIAKELGIEDPKEFLESLGIKPLKNRVSNAMRSGSRVFNGGWRSARSWFFEIEERIPASLITRHDGVVERENIRQGVIYDFNK